MASRPPTQPEWLPHDSESGSELGTFENNREPDETLESGTAPEWLHPPQDTTQPTEQNSRPKILSDWVSGAVRTETFPTETSSLRGGSEYGDSEYGGTESVSGFSSRSGGRRKKEKRGGARRLRVPKSSASGRDRLRLLEYKAGRPCCLTLLGALHCVTMVSALLSGVAMALDVYAIYANTHAHLEIAHSKSLTAAQLWELSQSVMLRLYGVAFTVLVVVTEMSEFEGCAKCLSKLHDNALAHHWWARGLGYVFVGLLALESGRQEVAINVEPEDGESSTAGTASSSSSSSSSSTGESGGNHVDESPVLDDTRALVVIRSGGTLLIVAGFLYTLLGVLCCKALKQLQVGDMTRARQELAAYVEAMAVANDNQNSARPPREDTPPLQQTFGRDAGQRGGGGGFSLGLQGPAALFSRLWGDRAQEETGGWRPLEGSSSAEHLEQPQHQEQELAQRGETTGARRTASQGGEGRRRSSGEEWPLAQTTSTNATRHPFQKSFASPAPSAQTELQRRYNNSRAHDGRSNNPEATFPALDPRNEHSSPPEPYTGGGGSFSQLRVGDAGSRASEQEALSGERLRHFMGATSRPGLSLEAQAAYSRGDVDAGAAENSPLGYQENTRRGI